MHRRRRHRNLGRQVERDMIQVVASSEVGGQQKRRVRGNRDRTQIAIDLHHQQSNRNDDV